MIYLINLTHGGDSVMSAACKKQDGADHLKAEMLKIGIELHETCWLAYWLQKHNFFRLAALVSMVEGGEANNDS